MHEATSVLAPSGFAEAEAEATGLRLDELARSVAAMRCRFRLVVLDASLTPIAGGEGRPAAPWRPPSGIHTMGLALLSGRQPGQAAMELESLKGGVFTDCLCKALKAGTTDTDSDGVIPLAELVHALGKAMAHESGKLGHPMSPMLYAWGIDLSMGLKALPAGGKPAPRPRLLRRVPDVSIKTR